MVAMGLMVPITISLAFGIFIVIVAAHDKSVGGVFLGGLLSCIGVVLLAWLACYGMKPLIVESETKHQIHMVGSTAIIISTKGDTLNVVKMFGTIPAVDKQEVVETRYSRGPYAGLYMEQPQKVEYKLVERAGSQ